MKADTSYTHISSDPTTCSGLPCIEGTRIRVIDIVALARRGRTPEEVLGSFEHLTLGQVHAALAYYHDHREEVDRQFDTERRRADEILREHPGLTR